MSGCVGMREMYRCTDLRGEGKKDTRADCSSVRSSVLPLPQSDTAGDQLLRLSLPPLAATAMSKRSHPGTAAAAAAAAVPTRATHVTAADSHAAAASSSSATGPSAKRIKFDDLVSSGFGAEAYGGKAGRGSAPTKSSVGGLALGQVEPERKSADDDGDGDGPSSAPLSAEEEMEAILRLVDSAPEVPEVDAAAARAILSKFGKAATKNLEMRAKFAAQPERFMESELALDESIHALQGLSSAAAHYPLLLEPVAGGDSAMDTLCSLIIHHENIDVSIDCIALLNELVDAETIGQEGDDIAPFVEFITGGTAAAASSGSAAAAASSSSAAAAAASSSAGGGGPSLFLSTLVSALQRFPSEHAKEQSDAVTNLLSVLENLTDLEPQRVSTALVQHTQLLEWIMKRLRDETFNQNKLYASEILSIVLTNAGVAGQDQMGARVLDGLGIKALIRYIAVRGRDTHTAKCAPSLGLISLSVRIARCCRLCAHCCVVPLRASMMLLMMRSEISKGRSFEQRGD